MPAKRGKNLTRSECIDFIVEMMETNSFRRGRTYKLLAEEWGLARSTVQSYTAEASRYVRRHILDPDAVAVDVSVAIGNALRDATEDAADPELRGTREGMKARDQIIAAGKVLSDISGASAPMKMDLQTTEATPEKARQLMAEFSKVTPKGETEG